MGLSTPSAMPAGASAVSSDTESRVAFAEATAAARAANAAFIPAATGPFQPNWESLGNYKAPDWFRDAKFGIWAHWGPQCQPEQGDWYARHMYWADCPHDWARHAYPAHVARYGHPSEFGFKDVINTWRAERWEPEKLLSFYKKSGARYFMTLANHHDNFDLWDSKYQAWNSTRIGPRQDIVARWAAAARAEGLRFAVSVHAAHTWHWYESAQGSDASGPRAGVPYDGTLTAADGAGKWWDGLDPQDLYAQNHPPGHPTWEWELNPAAAGADDPRLPDAAYVVKLHNRTLDLIERHDPDAVYFDDTVLPLHPVSDVGLRIVAHYYNRAFALRGRADVVVNGKKLDAVQRRALVYDIERGKSTVILPEPWQTDTCLGGWHYDRSLYERDGYKSATDVVHLLADIVSKNGNLMLSVPLRGDGSLDHGAAARLEAVGAWLEINGEAIYGTRPWHVFGEGSEAEDAAVDLGTGEVAERAVRPFGAQDVRYTVSKDGRVLHAILLGWPEGERMTLRSLANGPAGRHAGGIGRVRLLGAETPVAVVRRDTEGLVLNLPAMLPANGGVSAYALRIELMP